MKAADRRAGMMLQRFLTEKQWIELHEKNRFIMKSPLYGWRYEIWLNTSNLNSFPGYRISAKWEHMCGLKRHPYDARYRKWDREGKHCLLGFYLIYSSYRQWPDWPRYDFILSCFLALKNDERDVVERSCMNLLPLEFRNRSQPVPKFRRLKKDALYGL